MLNLTETAIRLYRQLFASEAFAGQLADGINTVLDGYTAIALSEATMTEVAVLSQGFLTHGSALAWLAEQQHTVNNFFHESLLVQHADSPRGALSTAMGITLSGRRSTVFLGAQEVLSCQDLLHTAVGRHLPLVIHVDNLLSQSHASTMNSGHDAIEQSMDSGCVVLFASNVQQAVDFTLIARHLAELTMTPVILVMDGMETAMAAQDVCLPSQELIEQFIGRADAQIATPSVAQKQLFSDHKRRVHNWHDLDRPVLQGALQSAQTFALGEAARNLYFADFIRPTLSQSFTQFAQLTARQYQSIYTQDISDAELIIIAQGSAIENLQSIKQQLACLTKKQTAELGIKKIGIIGLYCLRPFANEALIEQLQKNKFQAKIVVLQRVLANASEDHGLIREIRSIIQQHTEMNSLSLRSVIYGLGGSELKLSDLWLVLNDDDKKGRYLSLPFVSYDVQNAQSKTKEQHPKRQVMLDTLERYYPQIKKLGINNNSNDLLAEQLLLVPKKKSTNSVAVALSYSMLEKQSIAYAMDLSVYLHQLRGGLIRSSMDTSSYQWGKRRKDCIIQSEQMLSIEQSSPVDYFFLLSIDLQSLLQACQQLTHQGVLIIGESIKSCLTNPQQASIVTELIDEINSKKLVIYDAYQLHNSHLNDSFLDENLIVWEQMLALFVHDLSMNEKLDLKTRKIVALREISLTNVIAEHDVVNSQLENFKESLNHWANSEVENISSSLLKQLKQLIQNNSGAVELESAIISESVKSLGQNPKQLTDTYDSLPRFWDHVGILDKMSENNQLTVDPYLSTGTIPSLSATFNNMTAYRQQNLPVLNVQSCTACGECWANCPESAIAVVALTPKALLESSIKMSGADALRAITTKLASQINKLYKDTYKEDVIAYNAGELLHDAFELFKETASLPEDRMRSMEKDFAKAHAAIAELPLIASELFFFDRQKQQSESAELLSLVINPDSCKACGLCVELCTEQAEEGQEPALSFYSIKATEQMSEKESIAQLKSADQSNQHLYKKQWQIWSQTPDTSSATVEQLINSDAMPAGNALMLSRYNAFALSGGDHGEPGSGEKIALRQILSATEYHQQPILYQFISEVDTLRNQLKEEINQQLSDALPTDNLSQLAEKLSDIKTRQVDLTDLLEQSSQIMDSQAIDAQKTQQLVQLVLQLNELYWKISEGSYGLGRARYSLCISSSSIATWAGTFPYNPFNVPVHIDSSGEGVQLAAGLMHGQVQELLASVSLMRQAKACIDKRYAKATSKLKRLQWHDLSYDEQKLCPPLFVLGGNELLAGQDFSSIALLLNSEQPIKIIVLNELDCALADTHLSEYAFNYRQDSANKLTLMAMSQANSYVAQCSIADNDHLQQSVEQLLANQCAGLISIHAPSPMRHGFAAQATMQQAELALNSGIWPLFQYNPQYQGVFGSRITLHEVVAQKLSANNVSKDISPVYWALNERRFQAHFNELSSHVSNALILTDWLQLNKADRAKKIPYITMDDEQQTKLEVSMAFATMLVEQEQIWRILQELAGLVTPFTDYVEQSVEQRLQAEHQADLDALRKDYDEKVKQLQDNYEQDTHKKIRNQLLALSGYDAGKL